MIEWFCIIKLFSFVIFILCMGLFLSVSMFIECWGLKFEIEFLCMWIGGDMENLK